MVLSTIKKPGDLLVYVDSLEYCVVPAILRNGTIAAVALTAENMFGQYVKAGASGADFSLALVADAANVVGILIDGPAGSVAAATNYPGRYRVLKHAPCIVNSTVLPVNDVAGTPWVHATAQAPLIVKEFEFRAEPVKSTTQTT